MVAESDISFRLRGISDNWTREAVAELIGDRFPNTGPKVRSLADDPTRKPNPKARRTATLTFEKLPPELKRDLKEKDKQFRQYLNDFEDADETDWELDDDETDCELDIEFEGFTPLHCAPDDSCDIDIIAITGLNGHAFGSFKGKDRGKMWLRDFLPKDYQRARIFIYGYDTKRPSSQGIMDLAITFTQHLKNLRRNSRPRTWIIIGHSLGGLLAKAAIKRMAESKNKEDINTYRSLRAVFFFGVPSDGMNIESLRSRFSNTTLAHLVETINELNPELLREIHTGFFNAVRELEEFTSFNFYETQLSPTEVRVQPHLGPISLPSIRGKGQPERLVSKLSATQGNLCDDYPRHRNFPVNSSHRDLVKFSSRNDETYKIVVGCLQELEVDVQKSVKSSPTNVGSGLTKVEKDNSVPFKDDYGDSMESEEYSGFLGKFDKELSLQSQDLYGEKNEKRTPQPWTCDSPGKRKLAELSKPPSRNNDSISQRAKMYGYLSYRAASPEPVFSVGALHQPPILPNPQHVAPIANPPSEQSTFLAPPPQPVVTGGNNQQRLVASYPPPAVPIANPQFMTNPIHGPNPSAPAARPPLGSYQPNGPNLPARPVVAAVVQQWTTIYPNQFDPSTPPVVQTFTQVIYPAWSNSAPPAQQPGYYTGSPNPSVPTYQTQIGN